MPPEFEMLFPYFFTSMSRLNEGFTARSKCGGVGNTLRRSTSLYFVSPSVFSTAGFFGFGPCTSTNSQGLMNTGLAIHGPPPIIHLNHPKDLSSAQAGSLCSAGIERARKCLQGDHFLRCCDSTRSLLFRGFGGREGGSAAVYLCVLLLALEL